MIKSQLCCSSKRTGATLIVAIVAVTVTTAICVSLVRMTVLKQQQHIPQLRSAQAELLAEAALKKAVKELNSNPNYNGEVWTVAIDEISEMASSASISISAGNGGSRTIEVIARVPESGDHRAQRTITREWEPMAPSVPSSDSASQNESKSDGEAAPTDD